MRYEELRNYGLTEEQKAVRESAKKFTEKEILPVINEYEVKGRYPLDLIKKIGQLAIWGQSFPESTAGWGWTSSATYAYAGRSAMGAG